MILDPVETLAEPASGWLAGNVLVRPHTRVDRKVLPRLGGKGRGLARLERLGQPVPSWYAVTIDAFRAVLIESGLADRITERLARLDVRNGDAVRAAAEEIRRWVLALEIPPVLAEELGRVHEELGLGEAPLAVRSSAADEDGSGGSFAGLHDSVLSVQGLPAVLAALREVWASGWSERALAYRLARGLSPAQVEMAVVVQKMVPARVSGVLFTADPATGDFLQIVINSLYGLGEGLVGLGLEADLYTVQKEELTIEARLADKREQAVPGGTAGEVKRIPVPKELRTRDSLDREQVLALARAGIAIERSYGRPQDIEFAFDAEGRLSILQTRPIVTVEEYGPAAGQRIYWDHQNWAENYPGTTLPMTYSVTRRLEKVTYRCFAEMFRIPPEQVQALQVTIETSMGYVRGRIMTHGINRYRLFRLIPGINFNRKSLLALLGIQAAEIDRETPDPEPDTLRRWLVELPRFSRVVAGLLRDFLRVHQIVEDLLGAAREFQARCAAMDFYAMQPHELVKVYTEVELRLVSRWKAPLINVLDLRFLYVMLKKMCRDWCGDTAGSLPQQLLRGEEGSESGRPVRMMMELAHQAHSDATLRELFLRETPEELARRIPADPRFAAFTTGVEAYLDLFYFKGLHEMKLEDLTFRDKPELLYGMIQSQVAAGGSEPLDPRVLQERDHRARREAEDLVFSKLHGPRRMLFRWVLNKVRSLDHHREEFKFMRLQLMGLLRELLRAIGTRFAEEGILDDRYDIFYLTLDEVLDYIRGAAVTSDLRGLVALRRREKDFWEANPPDDAFETYGVVYHRNRFRTRRAAELVAAEGRLRGTGCCQGLVTGTVRLLHSPAEASRLSGEILVVERIHTGWLPLLPTVSGLLVERGEILSHSATVAREMGIPTIVGIPGLTSILRDGQRVTVDGGAGTVTILEEENGEAP